MTRFKVLTLNNIAVAGLDRLPRDRYEIASEIGHPDAILVRSADMHEYVVPDSLRAVGRAGVGVNNIPVDAYSRRGIPVFNAPFSNTRSVAELMIAEIIALSRQLMDRSAEVHAGRSRKVASHSLSGWSTYRSPNSEARLVPTGTR